MLLTKSPTPFVIYYNITYKVCIFLQYHSICYSCAGHLVPPLNVSYSMLYMTPPRSMFMISPINIPIFVSQPLLFLLVAFITWLHVCMHSSVVINLVQSVMWCKCLRMGDLIVFFSVFVETQARATTVPCVQSRTQYSAEDSDSKHNFL